MQARIETGKLQEAVDHLQKTVRMQIVTAVVGTLPRRMPQDVSMLRVTSSARPTTRSRTANSIIANQSNAERVMHVSRFCLCGERWYCGSGTEVSVNHICDEEEKRWFEAGSYMAIMDRRLISETKRRRGVKKRGVERRVKRRGERKERIRGRGRYLITSGQCPYYRKVHSTGCCAGSQSVL